jgi:LPXTG-site transpeptidase (sortase) family protein
MAKTFYIFNLKAVVGYLIVFAGLLFIVAGLMKEAERLYTFKDEPVDVKAFSQEVSTQKQLPVKIEIPEVQVDLLVRKANIIDGYWEVFEDSAGWGSGSGIPGKEGNQVIFAHARAGLFLPLLYIKEGMQVIVSTETDSFTYKVNEIKEVYPNQTEVIEPTEEETLTLYTCSGFGDEKRLIVKANRVASSD